MKFGIDLGHGVNPDRGAVGNIAEETIINEVGTKVISKLRALGHSVIELRPSSASSVGNSLCQRYTKADNNNVDMCISIHSNAGAGVGTEVFTYAGKHFTEADNVLNNLVSLGFRNRGIKDGSNLAMVRKPSAKAMLIEICFVDSSDSDLYKQIGSEKIANAIVSGLTGQKVSNYKLGWNKKSEDLWWYCTDVENGYYYNQGFQKIDNVWYYFLPSGYIASGWKKIGNDWYYFNTEHNGHFGELMSGWITYKGKKCYLNEKHDGTFGRAMKNETIEINGVKYSFDNDCYLIEK